MSAFNSAQKRASVLLGTAAAAVMICATPALAQETASPWTVEAGYTADVIGPVAGDVANDASVLDNIDIIADLDLGQAFGWNGVTVHGYLLADNGGIPNDVAGTLQGVDNIEVERQGVRLYELWIQAPLGERTTMA